MKIGVVTTSEDGVVTWLNEVAEQLTGWPLEAAAGQPVEHVLALTSEAGDTPALVLPDALDPAQPRLEEAMLDRGNGELLAVEYCVSTLRDSQQRALGLVITLRDCSDKRWMTLQLTRRACRDRLTDLFNRHAFTGFLTEALNDHRRIDSSSVLAFLDVDQLKLINSTCGHERGDDVLQWIAALLRETVGANDVAARLGGDEFAVLFAHSDLDTAVARLEKLQRRMQQFCFSSGQKTFVLSITCGVAELTPQFATFSDLLSAADQACFVAKGKGRGTIQVYETDDLEVVKHIDQMNWIAQINTELNSGACVLFGQPIIPLNVTDAGDDLSKFEVLLRFRRSDGQLQEPGELIRAAERFDQMNAIDRWVIRTTLRTLSSLPEEAQVRLGRCFINISGRSLKDNSLLDFIRSQLATSSLPPHKICFEITETVAVSCFDQARWFIQELSSIGCRLALDDFGTGVASYGYLRDLPVDYVKIGNSFIDAMPSSELDRTMVESIRQISSLLGISTVAEGVNNPDALRILKDLGISYAQGFWLGRPQPLTQLIQTMLIAPETSTTAPTIPTQPEEAADDADRS